MVHRIPALVWRDDEDTFTAVLAESLTDDETAALADTPAAALEQLQEYAAWMLQRPDTEPPDFHEARLAWFKLAVRPESRMEARVYADERLLRLRVPAVCGRQQSGLLVCSLPTLGLRFFYHDPIETERGRPRSRLAGGQSPTRPTRESRSLRDLVSHYAIERLKGRDVRGLTRSLPPADVSLEEVVVRTPRKRATGAGFGPRLQEVGRVAEPLGDRAARKGRSPAYEREDLVARLAERLGGERANVLLVGEAGVGKTTVIAAAARQLERAGAQHRFWQTSAARLIAGMQYLGQWQERCERVVDELALIDGVLCAASLADLVGDLAAFFAPYLERAELRMVVEATPAELDAARRIAPAFVDLFSVFPVGPLDAARAVRVLERIVPGPAAAATHRLFARFLPYEALPGRAVAFLRRQPADLTPARVMQAFAGETGLPEAFLRDDLPMRPDDVRAWFEARVIGQPDACAEATRVVTTFKAGLNDPTCPIAVLLFCGPTGVGKTEMARALARFFFGAGHADRHGRVTAAAAPADLDWRQSLGRPEVRSTPDERLIRLDMSEYAGPWAASRLLGEGVEGGSELVRRVREMPFSVVLLDEVEKADPSIFDVLMGVFDEGRLTDGLGRVTSFRSSLILMTSNLGTGGGPSIGFKQRPETTDLAEVARFFRPELFNRIDAVVRFQALGRDSVEAIVQKELEALRQREGLARRDLRLSWTDAVVARLASEGFDARYGARPLQRALESWLVAPLARWLVDARVRDCGIVVDVGAAGEARISVG